MRAGTIVLVVGIFATSCSIQRAQVAADAKSEMIGMSKEQVLTCMGVPSQRASVGETEVWSYPSGGDTTTVGSAQASGDGTGGVVAFGSAHALHKYCVVSVVMTGDKVSRVNYTGRTGGLVSQGEQCAFAVQNCIH
jgi:outer membrane protein assembly factor BamE (lipoprotein component of BamABCDE complex)